jgi:hypothetical protein
MATPEQIAEVRENVDEREDTNWADQAISALVDAAGSVLSASAIIWRRKAAMYADLVDVSEAGASHAFSDLHKNALTMADKFDAANQIELSATTVQRVKVKVIDRAYYDE